MSSRKSALRFHRWVSLGCLAFWFIQALTGVLIVFHWEIDDALVPGSATRIDLAAIESRIASLESERAGATVGSLWESGGKAGRFDLYLDAPEGSSVVLIDGAGSELRERRDDEIFANGGWVNTLVIIHHNLMGGETGSWIVGISGLVLISNILLGLFLAWPRRRQWQRALFPGKAATGTAGARFAWHRAVGLWCAVPALMVACAGVMLVFSGAVESAANPSAVEAPATQAIGSHDVGFARAVSSAMKQYPRARLSGVSLPGEDSEYYRVRLLQPEESRRVYGTTTLYVGKTDGVIAAQYDALTDGPARSFVDGLFPFHTGEMGGKVGRFAVMATGLGLLTIIVLGFMLWRRRSKR